ncbi:MAG: hypothetical protein ACPGC0_00780, partial [Opitutales bacterium]
SGDPNEDLTLPAKMNMNHALFNERDRAIVDAVIEGRNLQGAYQIPRLALRGSNTVYVLSENNTLQTREVRIVKRDPHSVIIESGLQPGEQVAVSPIAYFIENMPVNILPSE